jgi:hypothetical protein
MCTFEYPRRFCDRAEGGPIIVLRALSPLEQECRSLATPIGGYVHNLAGDRGYESILLCTAVNEGIHSQCMQCSLTAAARHLPTGDALLLLLLGCNYRK